jgi:hypothetical protein
MNTKMVKRKYFKLLMEVTFIFILIAGGLKVIETKINLPVTDPDEVSWIFTAYYFNLYFLRLELLHPDWEDYEAFDQPPLAKYIIGGVLWANGYTIDSLEPKRLINTVPLVRLHEYFHLVISKVPNPKVVIPLLRSTSFIFAFLSLLLIYASLRISYGVLSAVASTALIISNAIFEMISTRILADPILLFLFSFFILLCTLYSKYKKNIFIVSAFIVASLAFCTKLNGILLFPMSIIFFLVENKFSFAQQNLKYLFAGIICFMIITITLNPVYLNSGIKAISMMADARFSAFRNYQETFERVALLSVGERFVAATQIIYFSNSKLYQLLNVPVELIMFLIGTYYTFKKRDIILLLTFLFLVIIPISILPFRLPRYCYWIFPFTHMIAGQSICFFKKVLGESFRIYVYKKR